MKLINLIALLINNQVHGKWIHYEDLAHELENIWDWGRWNAECSDRHKAWWGASFVIAEFNNDVPF